MGGAIPSHAFCEKQRRHRPRHPRLPLRRGAREPIAEGLAGYFVEGNAGGIEAFASFEESLYRVADL